MSPKIQHIAYANLDDWNNSFTMILPSLSKFNETFTTEKTISETMNPSTIYFMKNFVSDSILMLASVKNFDAVPELSIGTVRKKSLFWKSSSGIEISYNNLFISHVTYLHHKIVETCPERFRWLHESWAQWSRYRVHLQLQPFEKRRTRHSPNHLQ